MLGFIKRNFNFGVLIAVVAILYFAIRCLV